MRRDRSRRWLWRLVGPSENHGTRSPTNASPPGLNKRPKGMETVRPKNRATPRLRMPTRRSTPLSPISVKSLNRITLRMLSPCSPPSTPRFAIARIACPTSKLSHDGNWRAACRRKNWNSTFHVKSPEEACGVTGPGVGSGDLLGRPRIIAHGGEPTPLLLVREGDPQAGKLSDRKIELLQGCACQPGNRLRSNQPT